MLPALGAQRCPGTRNEFVVAKTRSECARAGDRFPNQGDPEKCKALLLYSLQRAGSLENTCADPGED